MDLEKDETDSNTFRFGHTIRAVQDATTYEPTGRTIIVCLDGTGDQFDNDNSNIVHLMACLKKSDPTQVTYYQSGIGTYDGKGLANGLRSATDAAVGSGLGVHIRDAYRFLMENYKEGDRICLFGFSRGSYTARCLGGMVHKIGILPAQNESQIEFAYRIYKDDTLEGWKMSKEFKKTFCMNVNVYFIGVFDSVASVGFIPRQLPLSSTPTNKATYFRHAISMDEARAKFKPCRFKRKVSEVGKRTWKIDADLTPTETRLLNSQPETNVLEVWFSGCHCDVGGGAVKNEVRNRLSNIPLRWMVRQAFECNTGIIFKTSMLAEEGLDVHTLSPIYQKPSQEVKVPSKEIIAHWKAGTLPSVARRSGLLEQQLGADVDESKDLRISSDKLKFENGWLSEQTEDYLDSQASINDMLKIAKAWWILEVFPIKVREQLKHSDQWVKKVRMNLGRARACQETKANVHWTVKHRMESGLGYKPKVRMGRNTEWNIVY